MTELVNNNNKIDKKEIQFCNMHTQLKISVNKYGR